MGSVTSEQGYERCGMSIPSGLITLLKHITVIIITVTNLLLDAPHSWTDNHSFPKKKKKTKKGVDNTDFLCICSLKKQQLS